MIEEMREITAEMVDMLLAESSLKYLSDGTVVEQADKRRAVKRVMTMDELNKVRKKSGLPLMDQPHDIKARYPYAPKPPPPKLGGVPYDSLKRLNDSISKIPVSKAAKRILDAADKASKSFGPLGGIVIPPSVIDKYSRPKGSPNVTRRRTLKGWSRKPNTYET